MSLSDSTISSPTAEAAETSSAPAASAAEEIPDEPGGKKTGDGTAASSLQQDNSSGVSADTNVPAQSADLTEGRGAVHNGLNQSESGNQTDDQADISAGSPIRQEGSQDSRREDARSSSANGSADTGTNVQTGEQTAADAGSGKEAAGEKKDIKAAEKWLSIRERGCIFGIRFIVFLCTAFGRGPARLFVSFLACWYYLFDKVARTSSREALRRLTGREPSNADVLRHIRTFANVALDRLFFVCGKTKGFSIDFHGEEHMRALREKKKGAIMLMAHLGSFECGRSLAFQRSFAINIIGNFHNAAMISEALERLNPGVNTRLIDIGKYSGVDFVFKIQRCIENGELVAIMADRVGADGKFADVEILGGTASLPTGPYLLAKALGCPVFFACGLFTEPNRYDLYCEPLADRVKLPPRDRKNALNAYMQKYAGFVEKYAKMSPFNWFNFFPFWKEPDASSKPVSLPAPAAETDRQKDAAEQVKAQSAVIPPDSQNQENGQQNQSAASESRQP